MSRSYVQQDVYVDDRLAFTGAQVIDHGNRILVRARPQGEPRRPMATVLTLTGAAGPAVAQADTGEVRTWTGTVDDESVVVAAVGRPSRCLPCGRR